MRFGLISTIPATRRLEQRSNRRERARDRRMLFLLLALMCLGGLAPAQGGEGDPAQGVVLSPQSWAWQLEEMMKWLIATRQLVPKPKETEAPACLLDNLTVSGSIADNQFQFALSGFIVSEKPLAAPLLIPLFGPAHQVIPRRVTLNDRPAVVGFAPYDYFYLRTAEKSFVLKGEFSLGSDLSLTIPGPLNSFTASLQDGRVVEGNRLSGVKETTLHFEQSNRAAPLDMDALPPVFLISRAFRVQKEITFEYRVTLRSGTELTSLALPLPNGEVILDVPGYKDWKQADNSLVVPVAGRTVELTVHGTIPRMGPFAPDARSNYEWWLIESDHEHRILVDTPAKQVDSAESPIARQLMSARLYLVTRGQPLNVTVQPLSSIEALAAIAKRQDRLIVWTREGDLVASDTLTYENNGLDYLAFETRGKPIYFAVDGAPHKILQSDPAKKQEILVPLQKGSHTVTVQSLGHEPPGLFGGLLRVPAGTHGLTVSQAGLTLGLPERIIPLWFTGGAGVQSPIGAGDIICLLLAAGASLALLRGLHLRLAGIIALAGVYFLWPELYVFLLVVAALVILILVIVRRTTGALRWVLLGGLGLAGLAGLVLIGAASMMGGGRWSNESAPSYEYDEKVAFQAQPPAAPPPSESDRLGQRRSEPAQKAPRPEDIGNVLYTCLATVEGVTPVALPMPSYVRGVAAHRELVTRDRPLEPTLLYVTRTTVWPIFLLWLASLGFVLYSYWPRLLRGLHRAGELIQNRPAVAAAPSETVPPVPPEQADPPSGASS